MPRPGFALAACIAGFVFLQGCARSPEVKEARYLESGKRQLAKKDFQRAILQFQNAAKVMPKDAEPHYQMALGYLGVANFQAAVAHLRKATELNPKHAAAQVRLAEMMAMSGNKELAQEAQSRLEQVLQATPDNVDALSALAITEWRLGKPEDAERHLQRAFDKFPQNLKSLVTLVKVRLARKDLKGAEEILLKAAAQKPVSADVLVALGQFYVLTARNVEALQQFQRAAQLDPKNAGALFSLAGTQFRAGQKDQAEQTYRQIAALPDRQYKPMHAMYLMFTGKREAAVAEFEKLARADAQDREARSRLVGAYLAVGRAADSEKVLNKALQTNAKDAQALLQRAGIYLQTGRSGEAQKDLAKLLELKINTPQAHYLMAKVHQARGSVSSAKQELGEALKAQPAFLPARMDLARLLIMTNAASAALALLEERPAPQSLDYQIQRNWALIALQRNSEARQGIESGLKRARVPDLLVQDALLKLAGRDYTGARSAAEETLKISPADLRGLKIMVQSYLAQQQGSAAVQKVREYAATQPKSAPVQYYLGEFEAGLGNQVQARAAFTAAKTADPQFLAPDLALARLELANGQPEEARKRVSAALSANSGSIEARMLLAEIEESGRNYGSATDQYLKVLELDPQHVAALNNVAYLVAEHLGRPDDALKYAQRAKELAPDNSAVSDTIGWVLFRKGLYSMAVPELETAVLKGDTPRRKFHLAMAYLKTGDQKRGRETLQAVISKEPNLPELRTVRQYLGEESR